MDNPAAALDAHLQRQARLRRLQPALRLALVTLAVALPAFAGGMLTMRALTPPDASAVVLRPENGAYQLPVSSRQLTVTLVPLRPSAEVEAQLAQRKSAAAQNARELASDAGMQQTATDIARIYPLKFEVGAPLTLPDELFDAERQQYNTEMTLNWLMKQVSPHSFRTVAVLYADVYAEGYNYLFGQARLGGSVCVCSTARMGMDVGAKTPLERFSSIAGHELGHTLGLKHVSDKRSIMAFANSLPEHDEQGTEVTAEDWKVLNSLHPIRWERGLE